MRNVSSSELLGILIGCALAQNKAPSPKALAIPPHLALNWLCEWSLVELVQNEAVQYAVISHKGKGYKALCYAGMNGVEDVRALGLDTLSLPGVGELNKSVIDMFSHSGAVKLNAEQYEVIAGYSLGGAFALLHQLLYNSASHVVTFGSPRVCQLNTRFGLLSPRSKALSITSFILANDPIPLIPIFGSWVHPMDVITIPTSAPPCPFYNILSFVSHLSTFSFGMFNDFLASLVPLLLFALPSTQHCIEDYIEALVVLE